ncbi:MAG: amino acid permease [Candidatus Ancillula sp.]|jgi:D-serine/D-alanine/glycine transporter|nr:amino acid permease [Candidatus Ancillula sp.]
MINQNNKKEKTVLHSGATHSDLKNRAGGLARGLSNRHIQLIAIGGTIGTSLFVGLSHVLATAGPSAMFIYIIAGLTFFFAMRLLGEILLSNSHYKTFRDAAEDILGPRWGFTLGWMYMLFWIFSCAQDALGVSTYINFWFPDVPYWQISVILLLIVLVINLIAVKAFGELEFWFAIIKVVAIVVIAVVCLAFVVIGFKFADGSTPDITNIWSHGGLFPNGFSGFINAIQIAFLAYAGIELVGSAAAETKDPGKTLPKAINSLPIRISFFYVVPVILLVIISPWDSYQQNFSPFVQIFTLAGIGIAAGIMNFVLLTAAASGANSGIYASSRMLFGMSVSEEMPEKFSWTSKHSVPAFAVAFCGVSSAVLIFILMLIAPTAHEGYLIASGIASPCFLVSWLIIIASYLKFRKKFPEKHENSKFKAPAGIIMSFVIAAILIFCFVVTFFDKDARIGACLIFVWFALVQIGFTYLEKKNPKLDEDIEDLYL